MRKLTLITFVFFTCLTLAPMALAAGGAETTGASGAATTGAGGASNTGNTSVPLINPLKGGATLEGFLNSILDFVIRIGTIAVILMLVYIGFLYVQARGNSTKISAAHEALKWTIVGALILLGAKAISIGIIATVKALSVGN